MYFKRWTNDNIYEFVLITGDVKFDRTLPLFDLGIDLNASSVDEDGIEQVLSIINGVINNMNKDTTTAYLTSIIAESLSQRLYRFNRIDFVIPIDLYILQHLTTDISEQETTELRDKIGLNVICPILYQHRIDAYCTIN